MKKTLAIFYLMMALRTIFVAATVYEVGDSNYAGWTSIGFDYQAWAADKNFDVGDTLVFTYNIELHNVMQVTSQDFESCNAISPISIPSNYTNGDNAIKLDRPGHFYFICGFPGHCQAGQKMDILVSPTTSSPNPATAPAPSSLSSSSSASANLYFNILSCTLSVLASCLLWFAY